MLLLRPESGGGEHRGALHKRRRRNERPVAKVRRALEAVVLVPTDLPGVEARPVRQLHELVQVARTRCDNTIRVHNSRFPPIPNSEVRFETSENFSRIRTETAAGNVTTHI